MEPERVLDLFCGAGGAAMGLHRAWPKAEIIGVDNRPQPHYPFEFIQMDWEEGLAALGPWADFIWASPPCQKYSAGSYWVRGKNGTKEHPDLIGKVRDAFLIGAFNTWVIENVPGAPLHYPVTLCGSMFDLRVAKGYLRRHRLFETRFHVEEPKCSHKGRGVSVCGHGSGGLWRFRKANAQEARELLGIDWMNRDELAQAIPPAYSEYIARQYSLTYGDGR